MIDSNHLNDCLPIDDFLYCGVPKLFSIPVNVQPPTTNPIADTDQHLSMFSVHLQDLIKNKQRESKFSPSIKFTLQNLNKPLLPTDKDSVVEYYTDVEGFYHLLKDLEDQVVFDKADWEEIEHGLDRLSKEKDDLEKRLSDQTKVVDKLKSNQWEISSRDKKILELEKALELETEKYRQLLEEKVLLQTNWEEIEYERNHLSTAKNDLEKILSDQSKVAEQLKSNKLEISSRDKKILELEKRLQSENARCRYLLNSALFLQANWADMEDGLDRLSKEKDDLEKRLFDQFKVVEQLQSDQSDISLREKKVVELENKWQEIECGFNKLFAEKDDLEKRLCDQSKVVERLKSNQSDISSKDKKIMELARELQSKREKYRNLLEEKAFLEEEANILEKKLSDQSNVVKLLKSKQSETLSKDKKILDMEKNWKERESTLDRLSKEKRALENKLSDQTKVVERLKSKQLEISSKDKKILALEKELQSKKEKYRNLSEEKASLDKQANSLRDKLSDQTKVVKKLKSKQSEISSKDKKILALEKELKSEKEKSRNLSKEKVSLSKQADTLEKKISIQSKVVAQLKPTSELPSSSNKILELEKKLRIEKEDYREMFKEKILLEQRVNSMEQTIEIQLKAINHFKSKQVVDISSIEKGLESEREKYLVKKSIVDKKLDLLTEQATAVEEELNKAKLVHEKELAERLNEQVEHFLVEYETGLNERLTQQQQLLEEEYNKILEEKDAQIESLQSLKQQHKELKEEYSKSKDSYLKSLEEKDAQIESLQSLKQQHKELEEEYNKSKDSYLKSLQEKDAQIESLRSKISDLSKPLTNKTPAVTVVKRLAIHRRRLANLKRRPCKKPFKTLTHPVRNIIFPQLLGAHVDISLSKKYENIQVSTLISLLNDMYINVMPNNECSSSFDKSDVTTILKRIFVDKDSEEIKGLSDFVIEKLEKPCESISLPMFDAFVTYISSIRSISFESFLEVKNQINRVEENGFLFTLFDCFGSYYYKGSSKEFFQKLDDLYTQNPFPFLDKNIDIVDYVGTILSCISSEVDKDQTTIRNLLYYCLPYLSDDIHTGIVKKYNQDLLQCSTDINSNKVANVTYTLFEKWHDENNFLLNQFYKDLTDNGENNFFASVGKRLKIHKSFFNRDNILKKHSVKDYVAQSVSVAIFIDLFVNHYSLLDCQRSLQDNNANILTYQSILFKLIPEIYELQFTPLEILSLSKECIDLFCTTDFSKLINTIHTPLGDQQSSPTQFLEILQKKYHTIEDSPNLMCNSLLQTYIRMFCKYARTGFYKSLQSSVALDISLENSNQFANFVFYKLSNSVTARNSKTELKDTITNELKYWLYPNFFNDGSSFATRLDVKCSFMPSSYFSSPSDSSNSDVEKSLIALFENNRQKVEPKNLFT